MDVVYVHKIGFSFLTKAIRQVSQAHLVRYTHDLALALYRIVYDFVAFRHDHDHAHAYNMRNV